MTTLYLYVEPHEPSSQLGPVTQFQVTPASAARRDAFHRERSEHPHSEAASQIIQHPAPTSLP
jgi:hypothetical protein